MKKIFLFIPVVFSLNGYTQFRMSTTDSLRRDSINKMTHRIIKNAGQLNIDSTRRGPSGNPSAPNAANTDESKASPYTSLPDLLIILMDRPNFRQDCGKK